MLGLFATRCVFSAVNASQCVLLPERTPLGELRVLPIPLTGFEWREEYEKKRG